MKLGILHALRNPGTEYAFSVEQTMAPQDILGDEVTFDPVRLEGKLVASEDGHVMVEGTLRTIAHARCARCLQAASSEVTGEFRETFLHGGDPEDDEIFVYEGGSLDFERLTLTYLLLNLPMRFLCRENCPGLAQYAGPKTQIDKSETLCQDEAGSLDDVWLGLQGKTQRPFAALQQLLAEKSDNAE